MADESASKDDTLPAPARRAFEGHDAFDPRPDPGTYDCVTTPFEVEATAESHENEGRDARFRLRVTVPALAAVTEEEVGPAVAEGWFDSLERHLVDAATVAEVEPTTGPTVERVDDRIELTVAFPAWSASAGIDDVKTIVEYIEGTYVQSVIPGYTYQSPVTGLLAAAGTRAGEDNDGDPRRGGTPL